VYVCVCAGAGAGAGVGLVFELWCQFDTGQVREHR